MSDPTEQHPTPEVAAFLDRCLGTPGWRERLPLIRTFQQDLVEANARTNLTRILSPEEFWTKHVADSVAVGLAFPDLVRRPLRVADIGCGAGIPLFPLAWANPELRLTGIETNGKKVEFLEEEKVRLGFGKRVTILGRQAREAGRMAGHGGAYDVVVARAVTEPALLVRETRRLLLHEPGACLIAYTTPAAAAAGRELAVREARKFGLVPRWSDVIDLPGGAGPRQFLLFLRLNESADIVI